MTQRRSCCRRAAVPANPRDFCGSLATSTGVTLVENNGGWELLVLTPGGQVMNLREALGNFKCTVQTAGVRLADIVVMALGKAVASGRMANAAGKAGRQMPLIMMKDLLFKAAQTCHVCKGTGCVTCQKTGLAP